MLDPHLTKPQGEELAAMQAATVPGMAFWAGSGLVGKTCRECESWGGGRALERNEDGFLKDAPCAKFKSLMGGFVVGQPISHELKSCRYFTPAERERPVRMRWTGKYGWQPLKEEVSS